MKAVIFDLDGVIVTTDDCHYQAWKLLADEEGLDFDRKVNERLRGVSRMASLDIVLEKAERTYTQEEKLEMAAKKNRYYVELIQKLTPADILPGVEKNLKTLKEAGVKIAIGSSSKNASVILRQIGLTEVFDAVSDGNHISKSKPDPEVFLKAADMLEIPYADCLIVEDADAGIEAGKAAGMKTLAVNKAQGGDYHYQSLADVNLVDIIVKERKRR